MKVTVKIELDGQDWRDHIEEDGYDETIAVLDIEKEHFDKFIKVLAANVDGAADCYLDEED